MGGLGAEKAGGFTTYYLILAKSLDFFPVQSRFLYTHPNLSPSRLNSEDFALVLRIGTVFGKE